MAVPVQTPYQEYTANGVTTSFAVTFQCLSKDTLIVTINGVEQSPTLWSFTGGNVVFVAAPANLAIVGIKRSTALNREVTYQAYDNSFRPDVLNNDIDRLWHALQENQYIYNKKVDKSAQIQTLGNLQGGGQINGGLTLSLKDQTVTANYAFGSSIKIPVIELNQDGTVKSLHDVDLIGGAGGAFQIGWNDVLNKPTTLTGYGITDAYTKTEADTKFIEATEKGAADGVATLDASALLPASQLPQATTTNIGAVEIATSTEVNTATDNIRVVTPSTLLSGVKNHLNVSGNAPMYACRAWVNFNSIPLNGTYSQSGTTVTVRMTAHGMSVGQTVNLTITSGTAVSGSYPIATVADANTFTYTTGTNLTTSGNVTRNNFIRGSGNVLGITDNGVGDYTVNFITAMPDDNYCVGLGPVSDNATTISMWLAIKGNFSSGPTLKTASQLRIITGGLQTLVDIAEVNISIFR